MLTATEAACLASPVRRNSKGTGILAGSEPSSKYAGREPRVDRDGVRSCSELQADLSGRDAAAFDEIRADRRDQLTFVFSTFAAQVQGNIQLASFPADGSAFQRADGIPGLAVCSNGSAR